MNLNFPQQVIDNLKERYDNVVEIGEGGFGKIFSVEDSKKNKCVIKIMNLNYKPLKLKFKNEVKCAKLLNSHPNICNLKSSKIRKFHINLHDENKQQQQQKHHHHHHHHHHHQHKKEHFKCGYFKLEKMDCDLLDYLLVNPFMSQDKIRMIFREICKGVAHMHSKGIVHLDIKPENVLLKKIGKKIQEVKLCDFGSARFLVKDNANDQHHDGDHKYQPEIVATPFGSIPYLPPECMENYDPKSPIYLEKVDVYALGVVLFVLITNKLPKLYSEEGEHQLLFSMSMVNVAPLVSNDCYSLLCSMMSSDPSIRPSMQEVLSHPYLHP